MNNHRLASHIGQRISLPGHFDVPVLLEDARSLGADDRAGYECRVRLLDGSLEEAVVSADEITAISGASSTTANSIIAVDAEKLRLLIESARIRLAYAYDRQFAVSLSGIRTLPHQIEAVYQAMLPQPRLRFLLADDPGAGKTIMAGLLIKELKLRGAIERHTRTVTFRLNSDEYELYKSVTAYINEFIPQQTGQRRSSAALTRTVLQRRLVSSTCAIHESLKRRQKKQEELLEELENLTPAQRAKRLVALQGRLPDAEQEEDDLDDMV